MTAIDLNSSAAHSDVGTVDGLCLPLSNADYDSELTGEYPSANSSRIVATGKDLFDLALGRFGTRGPDETGDSPRASIMRLRSLFARAATTLCMVPIDAFSLTTACALGWFLAREIPILATSELPLNVIFAAAPLSIAYLLCGISPGIGRHPVVELRQLSRLNTVAFLLVGSACVTAGVPLIWALFTLLAWVASLLLVPLGRSLARSVLARTNWWGFNAVAVSRGPFCQAFAKRLSASTASGLRPVAFIDLDGTCRGETQGIPVIAGHRLSTVISRHAVSHMVLHLPDLTTAERLKLVAEYGQYVPRVLLDHTQFDTPSLWRISSTYGSATGGLEVHNGLLVPSHRLAKRAMDLALIVLALPLLLPLFVLLAIAVKLSSRGPIFYGSSRVGRNGFTFKAWKFRTMRCDGPDILAKLFAKDPAARAEWERDHKLKNDPRITRIGAYLRKSSLDEFPQLWNVVNGEMSLVGPRPILPDEPELYGSTLEIYERVRPGITGLWQISGRNNTAYAARLHFVAQYVRDWSPWMDLYILARTVGVILRGDGAC